MALFYALKQNLMILYRPEFLLRLQIAATFLKVRYYLLRDSL